MMYKNFFKPLIDTLFSLIGCLLLLPLFLLVTVALFFQTKGSPFFTQKRPGRHGKIFTIIKFKTMNDNTDAQGDLLPDSDRITTMGKFVRKTSLDEIPQLFNVFKGDMSIIGPRPLLPEYLELYSKEQSKRHQVKPGITGWAQVNGRNAISWSKKLELDVFYADNLNLKLDVKIFFKTIIKVLRSDDISSEGHATIEKFNGKN